MPTSHASCRPCSTSAWATSDSVRARPRSPAAKRIEHNLDVIKTADWVIDMGPEGGAGGGTVVAAGTPEDIAAHAESYTGHYLKPLLR